MPEAQGDAATVLREANEDLQGAVLLTVHRYRPTRRAYGFELKQFDREKVRQLIQDGYEAALTHDCRESRCIGVAN